MADSNNTRAIAFYLPQFHPIPENDLWWGKGFTEWTNVARARPLFRGHYQPHIPADLGFYDLRVAEVREAQAKMAAQYGIEGFCYYHYWFGGKRLLERPFDEVVASGSPEFPFCLCWANQTWSGIWHGSPDKVLVEQTYPGIEDHRAHFLALLPAFRDKRYIRVDNKPLFIVFIPYGIPDHAATLLLWREMALEHGLDGLHLVAYTQSDDAQDLRQLGYDGVIRSQNFKQRQWPSPWRRPWRYLLSHVRQKLNRPTIANYAELVRECLTLWRDGTTYPCVVHAFDNTPRSGRNGVVYQGSTPEAFRPLIEGAVRSVQSLRPEERFVFLKSWNEWAEGNHLEPDKKYGSKYLEILLGALSASRD